MSSRYLYRTRRIVVGERYANCFGNGLACAGGQSRIVAFKGYIFYGDWRRVVGESNVHIADG